MSMLFSARSARAVQRSLSWQSSPFHSEYWIVKLKDKAAERPHGMKWMQNKNVTGGKPLYSGTTAQMAAKYNRDEHLLTRSHRVEEVLCRVSCSLVPTLIKSTDNEPSRQKDPFRSSNSFTLHDLLRKREKSKRYVKITSKYCQKLLLKALNRNE